MAKKATVELRVLLKSAGIEATTKQVEALRKSLRGVATENAKAGQAIQKAAKKREGEIYRNQRGTAEATGRATKDFARMSQGLGGLVQAYATIAANVYALSSAFLVLRNAADLSSMIKSAEDFSNRFGRSVTQITKQIQAATGGALSFREALPSINKAISAGFSTEKIEDLAVAATKASQTFGGTANEALSRFISAAQRGRTEIVQTLGIVIQTEKEYENYAASIGRTKDELTAFQKQQAIVNAIIKESQNVFEGITIDPNPFTQFAITIADLKDTLLTATTDFFTPFINVINKSQGVAGTFIAFIGALIIKKLIPAVTEMTKAAAAAGIESSIAARDSARRAIDSAKRAEAEKAKFTKRAFDDGGKREYNQYRKLLQNKLSLHKAFLVSVFDAEGNLDTKRLAQQKRAIAREAKLREAGITKGRQKIFESLTDEQVKRIDGLYKRLGAGAFATAKANKAATAAQNELTSATTIWAKKTIAAYNLVNARIVGFKSQIKSGFASVFNTAQTDFVKAARKTGYTWRNLGRGILDTNVTIGRSFTKLGGAVGKTAGLMGGALTRLSNHLGLIMIVVTAATAIWSKYGDAILGITPAIRQFIDIQKELPERLAEISKRSDIYAEKIGGKTPKSLKELGAALEFTAGQFQSLSDELDKYNAAFKKALGTDNVAGAVTELNKLKMRSQELREELSTLRRTSSQSWVITPEQQEINIRVGTTAKELDNTLEKIQSIEGALERINKEAYLKNSLNIFAQIASQAQTAGLSAETIREQLGKVLDEEFELAPEVKEGFITDILNNELDSAYAALNRFDGRRFFQITTQGALKLNEVVGKVSKSFFGTNQGLASVQKDLVELNTQTSNYFGNFERSLLAQTSVINKEYAQLVLNARNTFKNLADAAKGNELVPTLLNTGEINSLKQFLGFSLDTQVDQNQLYEVAQARLKTILTETQKLNQYENALKITKAQQGEVNARLAVTAGDRAEKLRETNALELQSLSLQKQIAESQKTLLIQQALGEAAAATAAGLSEDERAAAQQKLIITQNLIALRNIEIESLEAAADSAERRGLSEEALGRIAEARLIITRKINAAEAAFTVAREKLIRSNAAELSNLRERNKLEVESTQLAIARRAIAIANFGERAKLDDRQKVAYDRELALLEVDVQRLDNLIERGPIEEKLLKYKQEEREITNDINILNERLKATSDALVFSAEDRINKLNKELDLQKLIARAELERLVNRRNAILADDTNDSQQREQLALIYAQIVAAGELLRNQERRADIERNTSGAQIAQQILEAELNLVSAQKELLDLRGQNATIVGEYLQTRLDTNALELKAINLEKGKVAARIEELSQLEEIDVIQAKQLDQELTRLQILDQQAEALRRQAESTNALVRQQEVGQGLIFSQEGIDQTAHFFRRALEEEIPKLKSTMEILGRGFADTVLTAFDTAVDNLLEGGEKFGEAVREGLKASLREVIGDVIKTNIRSSILDIMEAVAPGFTGKVKAQENAAIKTEVNTNNAVLLLSDIKDILNSQPLGGGVAANPILNILGSTAPAGPSIYELMSPPTSADTPLKLASPINAIVQEDQSQAAKGMEGLPATTEAGFASALAASNTGFGNVVSTLFNIISVLQTVGSLGGGGGGGGLFGAIGTLFGGPAPTPMASGGYVHSPSLLLAGEGGNSEAVVPLPNNREIPVEMRGGSGDTVNIEQNFDFRNADAGSVSRLRSEARAIEERTFNKVFAEINKGGRYAKITGRR